jgi:hypothetical protein
MPLDRFILILVIVITGAGVTVWLGATLRDVVEMPGAGWLPFVPAALVGYVIWRVISQRLSNRKDDRYDRTEK